MFKRKRFFLTNTQALKLPPLHSIRDEAQLPIPANSPTTQPISEDECNVLVINASHEMAKEITLQLTLKMPGCSIMYAPTIELARWMLKRRKIHLVVSSPILPDGSITKLKDVFEGMKIPPDVVVVGDINVRSAELLGDLGYEHLSVRKIGAHQKDSNSRIALRPKVHRKEITSSIKNLGADIRNDLNNPLQEIVAMVFVAQATGKSPAAENALEAIDKAAKNMAKVVSGLEEKILQAVRPYSAAG